MPAQQYSYIVINGGNFYPRVSVSYINSAVSLLENHPVGGEAGAVAARGGGLWRGRGLRPLVVAAGPAEAVAAAVRLHEALQTSVELLKGHVLVVRPAVFPLVEQDVRRVRLSQLRRVGHHHVVVQLHQSVFCVDQCVVVAVGGRRPRVHHDRINPKVVTFHLKTMKILILINYI